MPGSTVRDIDVYRKIFASESPKVTKKHEDETKLYSQMYRNSAQTGTERNQAENERLSTDMSE